MGKKLYTPMDLNFLRKIRKVYGINCTNLDM